jgi:hypothetical protein
MTPAFTRPVYYFCIYSWFECKSHIIYCGCVFCVLNCKHVYVLYRQYRFIAGSVMFSVINVFIFIIYTAFYPVLHGLNLYLFFRILFFAVILKPSVEIRIVSSISVT